LELAIKWERDSIPSGDDACGDADESSRIFIARDLAKRETKKECAATLRVLIDTFEGS